MMTTIYSIPIGVRRHIPDAAALLVCLVLTCSCAVSKYIPEGETFYAGIDKVEYSEKDKGKNATAATKDLESVLEEKPNNSFLGSARTRIPFTYPFFINKHFAGSRNFFGRWLYKNFGNTPKLLSDIQPELRATVGKQRLDEYGYFRSSVESHVRYLDRDSMIAKVGYSVVMGEPYRMDSIEYRIDITTPDSADLTAPGERLLQRGEPYGVIVLSRERQRIAEMLQERGYFYFKPEHIIYKADTMQTPGEVDLRVVLDPAMPAEAREPWHIGSITYDLYDVYHSPLTDSLVVEGVLFRFHRTPPVKPTALLSRIHFVGGDQYNRSQQIQTQEAVARLNTFRFTNVSYTPDYTGMEGNRIGVTITSEQDLPYFTELEATYKFKSNNQTGPGVSFAVSRKNLLRAGELLRIALQGNYEGIIGQRNSSYKASEMNSYELSLSTELTFPKLLIPYYSGVGLPFPVSSKISLSGATLNRGAFYNQAQFSASLGYDIEPNDRMKLTIQPLSLTYNHLLRETDRFREAIMANPALGLSFRNQVIPQMNYLFAYEYQDPLMPQVFSLQAYLAEAGNLFSLFYKRDPSLAAQQHKFLGAQFAQFLKGWLDLRYSYRFSNALQLAARMYGGAIYSYGNQLIAPYTEQFYAGGANSLRGFNVRNVGPGAYEPSDNNPMSFLFRTGDLKLEANVELRYKVLGQLELAFFVDAGNIWLLRPDSNLPDGAIEGRYFLNDIALNTGLGLRYDLNFLVVRADLGLALHRPDRRDVDYFNTFGKSSQPWAVHLAIGYPF